MADEGHGLLRDPREVAVNDAVVACQESADHYADAARRSDDTALAARFEAVAGERRALARELEAAIRRLDALPAAPDPDSEAARRAVKWVRARLSPDERRALVEDRLEGEEKLAAVVAAALREPLPEPARRPLERLAQHVDQTRRALAGDG